MYKLIKLKCNRLEQYLKLIINISSLDEQKSILINTFNNYKEKFFKDTFVGNIEMKIWKNILCKLNTLYAKCFNFINFKNI